MTGIDRHTVALISIIGSSLDVLGALYLAYDLLGGEHGPLRILTRAVTYSVLFGTGFGLPLGPVFGLVNGATHGTTLAWEYSRASRGCDTPGFWLDTAMSSIRGAGYAISSAWILGWRFGIAFGVLSTLGQIIAYRAGIRPTIDYRPARRPRINKLQLLAGANRTVGYAVAGYVSSLVGGQKAHAVAIGVIAGLVVGMVTVASGPLTPLIEWGADHVPEKRMGVVGIGLILVGFGLQSVQYWLTVLDVTVR